MSIAYESLKIGKLYLFVYKYPQWVRERILAVDGSTGWSTLSLACWKEAK